MEVSGIMGGSQMRSIIDPNKYKDWPNVAEKLTRLNAFLNKGPLLGPDKKEQIRKLEQEIIAMLNQESTSQKDAFLKRSMVPSVIFGCSFASFLVFAVGYGLSKPPTNSFFLRGFVASFITGFISYVVILYHSRKELFQTIRIEELIADIRKACGIYLKEPSDSNKP